MALEELEKELYKRDSEILKERRTKKRQDDKQEAKRSNAPEVWSETLKKEPGIAEIALEKTTRVGRKLFFAAIGASILIIAASGFYIYQIFSARGVTVNIEMPENVLIGNPFKLSIITRNDSSNVLNDASISLKLPSGASILGELPDQSFASKNLGSIGVGGINRQEFEIIVLEGEDTIKRFEASFLYKTGILTTPFEKKIYKDTIIGRSAFTFEVFAPNNVFSGENFEISLKYRNGDEFDFKDLNLRIEYPPSFSFASATLIPDSGNNFWYLGDLRSGSEGEITVKGSILGPEQAFFDLNSTISASFNGQRYDIISRSSRLAIAPSPLTLSISLNNDGVEYIAEPGEYLNYLVTYQNNTGTGLRDVVLSLKLIGEMFDFSSINTVGFVNSLNRAITWNAANVPEFRLLPAGARGSMNVSIRVKPAYPISRLNDKNFVLSANAQIESPTVPALVGAEKTIGLAKLETKVGGRIDIDAKAFFRDAASRILNSGPFPPQVDFPTQYTIHWELKNYATDVKEVEMRAFLLGGVRWTGKVQSNIESAPEYNERTQEIIWKIPRIIATRGILSQPLKAVFQIEATPSISFVNQYFPLVSETRVRAIDEFTGLELNNFDFAITTDLTDDTTVGAGQGTVRQ